VQFRQRVDKPTGIKRAHRLAVVVAVSHQSTGQPAARAAWASLLEPPTIRVRAGSVPRNSQVLSKDSELA